MKIIKPALAGTLESSDCQISISPNKENGIRIELESDVKMMFGDSVIASVQDVLADFQIKDADVFIHDKGALDCVIRARLQCAVCRATETSYDWSREDCRA